MNRLSIYTQFAEYAEKNQSPNNNHSVVENVLAYFGQDYTESEFIADQNHKKNLSILKTFILNKATDSQLEWLDRCFLHPNSVYSDATSSVAFLGMVMNPDLLSDCHDIQSTIENAVADTGNEIYASNNDKHPGEIMEQILSAIKTCKFAIFDFTAQNPGVYFEAGYALAQGKTVFMTCRDNDLKNLHFDTNHFRFIVWKDYGDLKRQLQECIKANNLA